MVTERAVLPRVERQPPAYAALSLYERAPQPAAAIPDMVDAPAYRIGKRAFDIAFALALLALVAPLCAVVIGTIAATSPGPVLFRQERLGRGGRVFTCLKFRSMVARAHEGRSGLLAWNEVDGPVFKIKADPRITPVGRWLRRLSIDELPQLVNVLRGEMSIVGPRPPLPEEVARYEGATLERLGVTPGLTCLWQVSGRSRLSFAEWVALDQEYLRRRSFWFDLWIVLRTVPAVLTGRGAH